MFLPVVQITSHEMLRKPGIPGHNQKKFPNLVLRIARISTLLRVTEIQTDYHIDPRFALRRRGFGIAE